MIISRRKKEAGKNLRSYEAENENGSLKISANTQNIHQYPDICGTDKMKEMEELFLSERTTEQTFPGSKGGNHFACI